jgi:predicted  nucleic acid-binding Zn-ribbon protein
MRNWIKIILLVVIVLVVFNVVSLFFGNSNIKSIKEDLEKAKVTADSALNELRFSQSKLDSITSDIVIFKSYINNIQKTVELSDAEKRVKEEKNAAKVSELKENIKKLRQDIETDSLPDIELTTLKKN